MMRARILLAFLPAFIAATSVSQATVAQRANETNEANELEADPELLVELMATLLPTQLDGKDFTPLVSMLASFSAGDVEPGLTQWQAFVKSNAEELGAENIARVGAWLVRASILEKLPELADPADRVRFARAVTARLRDAIAELEAAQQTIGTQKSITARIVVVLPYERSEPGTRDVVRRLTKEQLDAEFDRTKRELDSMSEMGEMESLRLQMAMDRMSKMMSTLSNLLKKLSDAGSTITQNIK